MKYSDLAREEIALYGVENANLSQLFSLVLRSNQTQILFELSSIGLRRLSQMSKSELMEIDGIGEVMATQIIALLGIAKQFQASTIHKGDAITSPEAAARALNFLKYEQQEHFVCLYLNTKNEILQMKTIFKGSLNASIVHPREVFREALKVSAAGIICGHNHPSGNPEPSREDIAVTKRLSECGNTMGIELLDHVIIGENKHISIKEREPYIFS